MGAVNRTCMCCYARVHASLIHDLRVKRPVCLACHTKRIAERKTYPVHMSSALPPKQVRLIRL